MEIKIPKIGLTFAREHMPQLGPQDQFLKKLKDAGIKYEHVSVDPGTLKASQMEFDHDAVRSIINNPKKVKSGVVISADGYILDGHHRWLAAYNKGVKIHAVRVHLPILELIRTVKSFSNTHYKSIHDVVRKTIKEAAEQRYYK